MKKVLITFFTCCLVFESIGQTSANTQAPLLFSDFVKGRVIMKSGDTIYVMMNYNTYTEKMLYVEKNKLWEISETKVVESVILNERIFIPNNKVFYEMIPGNKYSLFIQHRIKIPSEAKQAGYGSTSETSTITMYSNIISSTGSHYNLNINEPFRSEIIDLFWLRKGNKYFKANNIKQINKFFPEKIDEIESFVKAGNISFDDPEDMINLINFCNGEVMLSSSHTHSGPGKRDNAYYESQIIKGVGLAVKNMFPARITAGHKSFPQLAFNRLVVREDGHARESWFSDDHYTSENPERIPFGPVDREVGVIKIEDMNGQPKAILMNYAVHADIVCSNYEISADFPGVACKKVEEAFGNKVTCLFVQGGAGNQESLIISSRRSGPDDLFKSDYNTIKRVGELLAYEAVSLTKSIPAAPKNETDIKYLNDSLKFSGRFNKDASFNIYISTILINNSIVIATCPGEPFIQLQLELKEKIRDASGVPFLFGYTWYEGTWPNYIPDIKSAAQGGYGADQNSPVAMEVGSGEMIMSKHFENYLRLNGLMRATPGPVGFKAGSRWIMTEFPR